MQPLCIVVSRYPVEDPCRTRCQVCNSKSIHIADGNPVLHSIWHASHRLLKCGYHVLLDETGLAIVHEVWSHVQHRFVSFGVANYMTIMGKRVHLTCCTHLFLRQHLFSPGTCVFQSLCCCWNVSLKRLEKSQAGRIVQLA